MMRDPPLPLFQFGAESRYHQKSFFSSLPGTGRLIRHGRKTVYQDDEESFFTADVVVAVPLLRVFGN
jgi:hypothetical protein